MQTILIKRITFLYKLAGLALKGLTQRMASGTVDTSKTKKTSASAANTDMAPSLHTSLNTLYACWNTAGPNPLQQTRRHAGLQSKPQATLPVPHGAVRVSEPVGRCGPGDAGERSAVDGHIRHLLLQRGQLAVLHQAKHIQQAQCGKHRPQVTGKMTKTVRVGQNSENSLYRRVG